MVSFLNKATGFELTAKLEMRETMNIILTFYVNLNSSYFVKLLFVALTLLTGSAKRSARSPCFHQLIICVRSWSIDVSRDFLGIPFSARNSRAGAQKDIIVKFQE